MFLKTSNLIFENAKALRANPTHAEMVMWSCLKNKPLGCKFRRQHPIADYIADFYCHELKMIIEVDGNIHAEQEVIIKDSERQNYLEEKGLCFFRFTNDEVEKQMETVIKKIESYIVDHSKRVQNMGKPL